MKIAKLYSSTDIRIEDMPVPEPGPGEALMKTAASGICSGDLMPWYIEKKAPLVLGHEPAGVIVNVGEGVTDFNPGDRVFVHHHAPCMQCEFCMRGDYVHCETWKKSRIIPGGISEYILIPEINLKNDNLKLPDSVSFEDAVLIEPLACVLKGIKRAGGASVETALIIGLGIMGALHVLALKRLGTKKVIGADMVPFRLEKALQLGADEVIDIRREDPALSIRRLSSGRMANLVICGPNSAEAMETGIRAAAPGGKVVLFTPALPGQKLTLDPNEIYFNETSIIPSYSTGPDDTREALRMISEGHIRADMVVTHRFGIEETARAYALAAYAKDSLKVIIKFQI
jgi:L-iditol 2-dehydrogenase